MWNSPYNRLDRFARLCVHQKFAPPTPPRKAELVFGPALASFSLSSPFFYQWSKLFWSSCDFPSGQLSNTNFMPNVFLSVMFVCIIPDTFSIKFFFYCEHPFHQVSFDLTLISIRNSKICSVSLDFSILLIRL